MSLTQSSSLEELISLTKTQDLRAFARLLTVLERVGASALNDNLELLRPSKPAYRFGITGPPGAGKSTLVGQLIRHFRDAGLRVGVIAVDPSSPFSNGAILGDRIRYIEHFSDPGVFIRSLGSRGSLGGLSASAYLMVRAFDLAGFDIVLIESVGVGQTELEIMTVADLVAVTLVPESGDSIQAMKAGLLEIADLFIVNKGDREGADIFVRELEAALLLANAWLSAPAVDSHHTTRIIKTTATTGAGLADVSQFIFAQIAKPDWREARNSTDRLRGEARALLRARLEQTIASAASSVNTPEEMAQLVAAWRP
jgi:LAO/AO transport system kinase